MRITDDDIIEALQLDYCTVYRNYASMRINAKLINDKVELSLDDLVAKDWKIERKIDDKKAVRYMLALRDYCGRRQTCESCPLDIECRFARSEGE